MSSRRATRERVLRGLYAFALGGGDADEVIARVVRGPLAAEDDDVADEDDDVTGAVEATEEDGESGVNPEEERAARRFAEKLFLLTLGAQTEADGIISEHTKNWDLSRIALIDRILLRMAICEILRFEDIPPKVSINETIELAKRYSTANSGKFVNGILDAVLVHLTSEGRVVKTGRGLIGMDDPGERAAS